MQQLCPQHDAASGAIPSSQTAGDNTPVSGPFPCEAFVSVTPATGAQLHEEPAHAAVASDFLPASPTAAGAAAAVVQQQVFLASLAAELRGAIDRWCPVGRAAPRSRGAARISQRSRLHNAAAGTSSAQPPDLQNDGGLAVSSRKRPTAAKDARSAEGTPSGFSPAEYFDGDGENGESCAAEKDSSTFTSVEGGARSNEDAAWFSPPDANHTWSAAERNAPLPSVWGKQARRLYSYSAVRVIGRSAVRLPAQFYREEAAIEEEDAGGLLGCLEEDGFNTEEDEAGSSQNAVSLKSEERYRSVSSERQTEELHQDVCTVSRRQRTGSQSRSRAGSSARGNASHSSRSSSRGSSSSSIRCKAEEVSHRWGEWPLRVPSSEDTHEYLSSATDSFGREEGGTAGSRVATDPEAAANEEHLAYRPSAGIPVGTNRALHTAAAIAPATAEEESLGVCRRAVLRSAVTQSEAAGLDGPTSLTRPSPRTRVRTDTTCCWETSDTFFEDTPSSRSHTAAVVITSSKHNLVSLNHPARAAAASAAAPAVSAAGELRNAVSPPLSPGPPHVLKEHAVSAAREARNLDSRPPAAGRPHVFDEHEEPSSRDIAGEGELSATSGRGSAGESTSTAAASTAVAEYDASAIPADNAAFSAAERANQATDAWAGGRRFPAEACAEADERPAEICNGGEEQRNLRMLVERLSAARKADRVNVVSADIRPGENVARAIGKRSDLCLETRGRDRTSLVDATAPHHIPRRTQGDSVERGGDATDPENCAVRQNGNTTGGETAEQREDFVNNKYTRVMRCAPLAGDESEATQGLQQLIDTHREGLRESSSVVTAYVEQERHVPAAAREDGVSGGLPTRHAHAERCPVSDVEEWKKKYREDDEEEWRRRVAHESAGETKIFQNSGSVEGRNAAALEEIFSYVTSASSRSSRGGRGAKGAGGGKVGGEEEGETRGEKQLEQTTSAETIAGSRGYKVKSLISRKALGTNRSTSAPVAQRSSPRHTFSRRGAGRAASSNKGLISSRILQRGHRLRVDPDEEKGAVGVLQSPTRASLFSTVPSRHAADNDDACWGVPTDPRASSAATKNIFAAEARQKLETDPHQCCPGTDDVAGNSHVDLFVEKAEESGKRDKIARSRTTSFLHHPDSLQDRGVSGGNLRAKVSGGRNAASDNDEEEVLPVTGNKRETTAPAVTTDRVTSAQETAPASNNKPSNPEKERYAAATAEHVLLRHPTKAAAAAAAAAAACRRQLFNLYSPVAPESPADAPPPTAVNDINQFVHVWLEGCCRRLQAVAASSAAQEERQPRAAHESSRGEAASATQVRQEPLAVHALLMSSKRQVKEELKAYDVAFFRRYGRVPERPEKEPLRPLYSHYQLLRRLLLGVEKSAEVQLQGHPGASSVAAPSRADTFGGSTVVRADSSRRKKEVTDEMVQHTRMTAEEKKPWEAPAETATVQPSAATAPADVAAINGEPVGIVKGVPCESDLTRQRRRLPGHQELHRSSETMPGTERAVGAAALPVVVHRADAGTGGENVCEHMTGNGEVLRKLRRSSNDGVVKRGVDPSVATGEEVLAPAVAEATEVVRWQDNRGSTEGGHCRRQSLNLGDGDNCGGAISRPIDTLDKDIDRTSVLFVQRAAVVTQRGCRQAPEAATHLAGNGSVKDGSVKVCDISAARSLSAKPEVPPAGTSAHLDFVTGARPKKDKKSTLQEERCQGLGSDNAPLTVTKPGHHRKRTQVIADHSFSSVCAAGSSHAENCFAGEACAARPPENLYDHDMHANYVNTKTSTIDSRGSRDCHTHHRSKSLQRQHHQLLANAPASTDTTEPGTTDARETRGNYGSRSDLQESGAPVKSQAREGSRTASVGHTEKISAGRAAAHEVKRPLREAEATLQSASVHSQVESAHKAGPPFLASAATECQQRLVRLQQEKRTLRTKLLAYQAEFTAETGRVVQLYKDIAPIEREYRRYKEVKQEIARLIDKQCEGLFPTEESEPHCQSFDAGSAPSEKFDKRRREVCAS